MTAVERLRLAEALELMDYKDGDILFRQNDPGTHLYFIGLGRIKLLQQRTPAAEPYVLARLDGGAAFGESALLYTRPRQASAVAVGTVRAYRVSRTSFEAAVGSAEDILKRNKAAYWSYITMKI